MAGLTDKYDSKNAPPLVKINVFGMAVVWALTWDIGRIKRLSMYWKILQVILKRNVNSNQRYPSSLLLTMGSHEKWPQANLPHSNAGGPMRPESHRNKNTFVFLVSEQAPRLCCPIIYHIPFTQKMKVRKGGISDLKAALNLTVLAMRMASVLCQSTHSRAIKSAPMAKGVPPLASNCREDHR